MSDTQESPSLYVFGNSTRAEFTVKEFARRELVTVRTVKRWISKGAVEIRRTPGGGVRIIDVSYSDIK